MTWLLQVLVLLVCSRFCSAADKVKCECLGLGTDSDGTVGAYRVEIGGVFGQSKTCEECHQKTETEVNRVTKNGDLHSYPFFPLDWNKFGTLLCKNLNVTSIESTTITLYSVCNGGAMERCNFAIRNPGYICCHDHAWPDAGKGPKCPPPS